jgi:hypothetical protein
VVKEFPDRVTQEFTGLLDMLRSAISDLTGDALAHYDAKL